MSRIGSLPIKLPEGVEINVSENNALHVKGPKGELQEVIDRDIMVKVQDGEVVVERPTNQKRHKALHGLYRSLINNMVIGVTEGYKKQLEVVGVGYRANVQGANLELNIGFSHAIVFALPQEVKATVEAVRGKNPIIILEGIDKQLIGQIAAKIRSIRPPEPYKGKGIKYVEEFIRRKTGKAAAATEV